MNNTPAYNIRTLRGVSDNASQWIKALHTELGEAIRGVLEKGEELTIDGEDCDSIETSMTITMPTGGTGIICTIRPSSIEVIDDYTDIQRPIDFEDLTCEQLIQVADILRELLTSKTY